MMELESVSKVGLDDFIKFMHFDIYNRNKPLVIFPCVMLAVFHLIAIVLGLYDDSIVLTVLAIITAAIALFLLYIWVIMPRSLYKASIKELSLDQKFFWYEDHFTVKDSSTKFDSTSEYKYSNLSNAYESADYLYLSITKNQAHLIPKNSFTKGTWMELSNILKKSLGDRYKVYR